MRDGPRRQVHVPLKKTKKGPMEMDQNSAVTRRSFLKATGAAAAGMMAWTARSRAQVAGANSRLNVAFIGCGGMAGAHLGSLLGMREQENLGFLAVCDVYETRAKGFQDKIKAAGGEPRLLRDYREVLAIKDLDYVVIATPEHAHAHITLDALDAGKHVYCEKPVTHTIPEAQAVLAKTRQTGLKVQVGVQGMSDDSYAAAYDAIREGKIGPVIQAQIDYVRWHTLEEGPWRGGNIDPAMPKPADLDWDTWLKPAPQHAWEARRYFHWRNYRDYSGGIGTDLFVHRITRLIRSLGLSMPSRVAGMGGIYLWPDGRDLPDNFEMLAEYPAVEGVTPGLTVHVLGTMANDKRNDHCIRGQKGTLTFTGEGWRIVEQGKPEDQPAQVFTKTGAEDIGLHHKNHHAAIRDNKPLNCPPELGLFGLAPVVMANESWFTRKMILWDEQNQKMTPA